MKSSKDYASFNWTATYWQSAGGNASCFVAKRLAIFRSLDFVVFATLMIDSDRCDGDLSWNKAGFELWIRIPLVRSDARSNCQDGVGST